MATPYSKELSETLIAQLPDAIVFADTEGTIQVWNAAAERMFGFSASKAIGANLNLIIPERFREAHWRGFKRAMEVRQTKYVGQSLTTRSIRSDGTSIYVELSFAVVLGPNGNAIGALATARDATERFEKERRDRNRLQELEKLHGSA